MRKLLSFLIYCVLLALLDSAGQKPAVPADAPAALEVHYVALTFDDGPQRATTEYLLDGLRERGAAATFFLVGERIAGNEDLLLRMWAEGHQVGNHTWSHVRLEGADSAALVAEVQRTDMALREILGERDYWLRPPYGMMDDAVARQLTVPAVKWSVDPRDWESRNTEKTVRAITGQVKPNDIVLLHDIYPTSVEAALQVIDTLQARGYRFVTVEELLRLNGVQPSLGILYRSGNT